LLDTYLNRYKELSEDYFLVKKLVLDYNYQLGRLRAFQCMAYKFRDESEKILDEVKLRIKQTREKMEEVDLRLIKSFQQVIHRKRIQTLYFNTLGQLSYSKCVTKGLDVTYVSEYLMVSLVKINYWQTLMSYVQLSKKKKIDEDNRMRDQFDTIMFCLMRF
jgi:hypothetical protein